MAFISDGLTITLPVLPGVFTTLHFIVPALAKGGFAGIRRQMIIPNARPSPSLRILKVGFLIDFFLLLADISLPFYLGREAAEESHSFDITLNFLFA